MNKCDFPNCFADGTVDAEDGVMHYCPRHHAELYPA